MAEYLLTKHTFVCVSGPYAVILDLKNDRYIGMDSVRTGCLAHMVRGWPAAPVGDPIDETASDNLARDLVEQQLLTSSLAEGKNAAPPELDRASQELNSDAYRAGFEVRVQDVAWFLWGTVSAAILLKCLSIEQVVARIKRRAARAPRATPEFDPDRVTTLVTKFERLRPLVFSARDRCLFEAVALTKFLAFHNVHPRLVFGVRCSPFAAHCWLQQNQFVLNDTVDRVTEYAPIMVV